MALSFNGSGRVYIGDTPSAPPEAGGALTVACWFKPTTLAWDHKLINRWNDAGGGHCYSLIAASDNKLQFLVIGNDLAGHSSGASATTLSANTWYHMVGTVTAGANPVVACFINGASEASAGFTDSGWRNFGNSDLKIAAGGHSSVDENVVKGVIAEVGIWTAVLSADEIAALGKGAPPLDVRPGSLRRYWPLHGAAATEPDFNPNGGGGNGTTTTGTLADHAPIARPRITIPTAIKAAGAGTIAAPFISAATTVYTPGLGNVLPPFIARTTTLYAPTLAPATAAPLSAPFIAASTTVYAPTLGKFVSVPFISAGTTVHTPLLLGFEPGTIASPFIAATTVVYGVANLNDPFAAGPGTLLSGSGTVTYGEAFTPVEWRIVICDLQGRPLSLVSRIALEKRLSFQLDRASQCAFTVPSLDPQVQTLHTDGYPFLNEMNRVVKAYRKEFGAWRLRFAGVVWTLEDQGEEDAQHTLVTAFDPLQMLTHRVVLTAAGSDAVDVTFNEAGAQIIKKLIQRSIDTHGTVGLGYTGSPAQLQGSFAATTALPRTFYEGTDVASALASVTDTGTCDVTVTPVDRTDGTLAVLSVSAQRGSSKPAAVFAYNMGNHTITRIARLKDGDRLANDVTVYGGRRTTAGSDWPVKKHLTDAPSIAAFHRHVATRASPELTQQAYVDALTAEELRFRKQPRELLSITPAAERAPLPFLEYDVGDSVPVYAEMRETIAGEQRVYGFTIDVDDNAFEHVGELVAAAA